MAVLHGIVVDVVDMAGEIGLVATVIGHDEFGWWASLALSATLQASLPVANVLLSFAA